MNTLEQHQQFTHWTENHMGILFRVVNGFAQGEDRNDLMQEVLLSVWKAIPQFRGQCQPTTFLYRVSHNAALSWHRSQKNYHKHIELGEAFFKVEFPPEDSSSQNAQLAQLYGAIRTLPELNRSLILLSLDGLSYEEMANIHGLSATNVGARLSRNNSVEKTATAWE